MPNDQANTHSRLFPGLSGGPQVTQQPWVNPPPGFLHIDRNRSGTIATDAGLTLLETIQITQGYEGWITKCGVFSGDYTNSFFTIRRANQPEREYARITVPLGQTDSMDPILLKISANEPLQLFITGTGAPGGFIGWRYRLFGWYYLAKPGR